MTTGAPRRILVIEDNEDAREMLRALLQGAGHSVRVAGDGESGIIEAMAFRPDVALIDVGLPGISGYDVARQLRKEDWGHTVRLIAVTGYGQPEDRRRATDAGFDDHLVKPVDADQLAKALVLPDREDGERSGSS